MKGIGHGIKHNKITVVILISGLFSGAVVIGAFHFIDREDSVSLENVEDEVTLTEEEYQLLQDSIRPAALEQMCNIERRNTYLILNAMADIAFTENRAQGQSNVGFATRILDLLGVGEIKEITPLRIDQNDGTLQGILVTRIITVDDSTYYMRYHQTWGTDIVRKESEDGETVYDRFMHVLYDGRLCEREYPRSGPFIDYE
jgi:hypothetical protein